MRCVPAWRVLTWPSAPSLLIVTSGTGWAAPAPTFEVLTARRTALITRIAELTDRAERDQAAVVVAQQRRSRTGSRPADARQATRDRARKAYMHGLGQTAEALARPNVYLEVSFRRDRRAVEALRAARAADDGAVRRRFVTRRVESSPRRARSGAARAGGDDRNAGEARRDRPGGDGSDRGRGLRPTGEVIAGTASWYGPGFDGRPTASGAIYDMEAWTCAHRTLPFGTLLLVSAHGRQVLVVVNDRGPYHADWVLDLSHAAAVALGQSLGPVSAEVLVPA